MIFRRKWRFACAFEIRILASGDGKRPINPPHRPPHPPAPGPFLFLIHPPSPNSLPTMRSALRPLSSFVRLTPAAFVRQAPSLCRSASFSKVLAQEALARPPEHIRPLPTLRPRLSLPIGADRSFENHKREIIVEIDGNEYSFDTFFLRDLCPCPKCLDASTKQKLFNTTDLPDDIVARALRIKSKGQLEVIWSAPEDHPHVSFYEPELLLQYSSPERRRHFRNPAGRQVYWDGDMMRDNMLRVDYQTFLESDEALHKMLVQLHRYGLAYFSNVPSQNTDGAEIGKLAERFGDIKRTFYGKTWDVKSVPESKNIAYLLPAERSHNHFPPYWLTRKIHKLKLGIAHGSDVLHLSTRPSIPPLSPQHGERRNINLRRLLPRSNPPPPPFPPSLPIPLHNPRPIPLRQRPKTLLLFSSHSRTRSL
jgi:Gamma-butyrobetaine hydroxylase-like, N-terminal/Taurine catabolism dioxygenase TauD, TfdA family